MYVSVPGPHFFSYTDMSSPHTSQRQLLKNKLQKISDRRTAPINTLPLAAAAIRTGALSYASTFHYLPAVWNEEEGERP